MHQANKQCFLASIAGFYVMVMLKRDLIKKYATIKQPYDELSHIANIHTVTSIAPKK